LDGLVLLQQSSRRINNRSWWEGCRVSVFAGFYGCSTVTSVIATIVTAIVASIVASVVAALFEATKDGVEETKLFATILLAASVTTTSVVCGVTTIVATTVVGIAIITATVVGVAIVAATIGFIGVITTIITALVFSAQATEERAAFSTFLCATIVATAGGFAVVTTTVVSIAIVTTTVGFAAVVATSFATVAVASATIGAEHPVQQAETEALSTHRKPEYQRSN
jgi:hypothetical protein